MMISKKEKEIKSKDGGWILRDWSFNLSPTNKLSLSASFKLIGNLDRRLFCCQGRGLAIGFCQRRKQMKADEGCGTKRWEVVKVVVVANDIGAMLKKDCNLQICVQCIYEVDGTRSQYDSNLKELVPGLLLYPDFLIWFYGMEVSEMWSGINFDLEYWGDWLRSLSCKWRGKKCNSFELMGIA